MPELPEVETTRRGIEPHLRQQTIAAFLARHLQLRWPIDPGLRTRLPGQMIQEVTRRGKYLLLHCTHGVLIIHLGMSGSLRILSDQVAANKHDHIDIILTSRLCLRFTDPRRFGCVLWTEDNPALHTLLKNLGPEPLTMAFNGDHLYRCAQDRNTPIKTFIMDGKIVVGVGNIYANEALFYAGIHPQSSAKSISQLHYKKLAAVIKRVLQAAIQKGGTTLRDFSASDGRPGYFQQQLYVYGRGGDPCLKCQTILEEIRLGQRSTVYCPRCQVC
jgi:formamidopyrimidine-DNA glycosylase